MIGESAVAQMAAPWLMAIVLLAMPLCWLLWKHQPSAKPANARKTQKEAHQIAVADEEIDKSAPRSQPNSQLVDGRGKTFRVRDIPTLFDAPMLKQRLQDLLSIEEEKFSIRSLAVDALNPQKQVATVEFEQVPASLQAPASTTSWELKLDDGDSQSLPAPRYILLDTTFLGLTTLSSPPADAHRADIIAVSGLGGHAFGSFKQRQGGYMWLRDSLPSDLEGVRVMVYGHDSHLHKSNSFQDLEALSRSFGESVRAIRVGLLVPKVFIGHSLGGLIIKQSIIQMNRWKDYSNTLSATRGIMFLGVPSQGMDIESLLPMVEGQPNELFLHTLGPESQLLRDQCEQFNDALVRRDLEVICYYETEHSPTAQRDSEGNWKMIGPPKILVSSNSARHGRGWETGSNVGAINKSHSNMAKFDRNDQDYIRVLQRLRELLENQNGNSNVRALTSAEQECLRSLSFPEMNSRQNSIPTATDQTCEWIFEHPTFQAWQREDVGLLWIKGKPGSGKSTLFKHLLMRLKERSQSHYRHRILSFLFHGRGTEMERTPLGLFQSLSHQLFQQMPDVFCALVEVYDQRTLASGAIGEKWAWHPQEVQNHFEQAVSKALDFSSIDVLIDALDECGEGNARELVKALQRMASNLRSKKYRLSVCFTCRHYPILSLDYGAELCTEDQNRGDIELYIDKEFPEIQSQGPDIRNRICERAQGVFQWAVLVTGKITELLHQGKSTKAIINAIDAIPPNLARLYEDLLNSLETHELDEAVRLMCWISSAVRPLQLSELRFAMVFLGDDPPTSLRACCERDDFVDNDQRMRSRLTYLSRGLAETRESGHAVVVQFIHQSVQDFVTEQGLEILQERFMPSPKYTPSRTHSLLSLACMNYIAVEEYRVRPNMWRETHHPPGTAKADEVVRESFASYAVTSLILHIQLAQESRQELTTPDCDLVRVGRMIDEHANAWMSLYERVERFLWNRPALGSTLLHIVSQYGLTSLLPNGQVAEVGGAVDEIDGEGQTPLTRAAENGHAAVVKQLLATGKADVNFKILRFLRTPLSLAAAEGHLEVVKLLAATGEVDLDARDIGEQTPLSQAAENGHDAVVRFLINTGRVDVTAADFHGLTPLSRAALNGHAGVVEQLLATGQVDVDARDKTGRTPLTIAILKEHPAVVELLLKTGQVNVNSKDAEGTPHLGWAAWNGNEAVMSRLLSIRTLDVEATNRHGMTPLAIAAYRGKAGVVEQLICKGKADTEARDVYGRTPLSLAAEDEHGSVVDVLLRIGMIDVDSKDNKGATPLWWAASLGREYMVRRLLETGRVDSSCRDAETGSTPFLMAAVKGHLEVVCLLLLTGRVDIEARDAKFGVTPLGAAAGNGCEEVVRLLLASGKVDADARNHEGQTPLALAARSGHEAVVEAFLESGMVAVEAEDDEGRTPLWWAAERGHEVVERILLEHGACVPLGVYGLPALFDADGQL